MLTSPADESSSAARNCVDWAVSRGAVISNVRVSELPGRGNSLIVDQTKSSNVSQQSKIIIPKALLLTLSNILDFARENVEFQSIMDEYSEKFSMTARRAIVLLMAFSRRSGSPWSIYLESLPATIDSPIFWTPAERRLLEGTSIEGIAEDRLAFLAAWLQYQQSAPRASGFTQSLTLDELLRYEMLVDSRALLSNEDDSCMVPVIDFANHSSLRPPDQGHQNAVWEMTDQAFELHVSEHASQGEEILFSYGKRGNGELLFKYGFVEDWQVNRGSRSITLEADQKEELVQFGEPSFRIGSDEDDDVLTSKDSEYLWLLGVYGEPCVDWTKMTFDGLHFNKRSLRSVLQNHGLWSFINLKVCFIVSQAVESQLARLDASESDESLIDIANTLEDQKLEAINAVRDSERVTYEAQREVMMRKQEELLSDDTIQAEIKRRGL